MAGESVEPTLELRASSLRDIKERGRPPLQQERMAALVKLSLDALLEPERRKTDRKLAEIANDLQWASQEGAAICWR